MRRPRIYTPQPLTSGTELALEESPARHLVRVLRLQRGAEVSVFNGRGGEYSAVIERIERDEVRVRVGAHVERELESPLSIWLGQGISRGDRMDYTLQKAVEMGVGAVFPLAMERSVVKLAGERADKRMQHWQGVVNAACEQCGRNTVPQVHAPQLLTQWGEALPKHAQRLMLLPGSVQRLRDIALDVHRPVALLIGPEGGMSEQESAIARAAQFIPVSLGPRILRTETASIAALAALQLRCGDL
ncbi:MAG: 16S rRNA (uracil(1498)-N(3))-methyltransferase [Pseudomonadota bacterium]